MYILGINAYHGDAAAAIIRDGELIAAVEEERFTRVKHCAGFPAHSVRYCLEAANIGIEDVQHIGISRDPSAHLHKKILSAAGRAGKRKQNSDNGNGNGLLRQVADRLENASKVRDLKAALTTALKVPKNSIPATVHNIEHHLAHLASSFYVSPFKEAALLSLDGFGDFISTMWAIGSGNEIKVIDHVEYPHSIGIAYTATTQFLGFPHYGDEGKVMGLAPYGRPVFIDKFRDIIRTEDRGQFRLNLDYFKHHAQGVEMTWDEGSPIIGRIFSAEFAHTFGPPRKHDGPLTERDENIAASLQLRLEEIAFHVLNHLHEQTGLSDLGLSGGVAYNSVMNGKVLLHTPFRRMFVQPAAGDSGTAIGVCYEIWNKTAVTKEFVRPGAGRQFIGAPVGSRQMEFPSDSDNTSRYIMRGAYTGPEFSSVDICKALEASNLEYETYSDSDVTKHAAQDIADGLVVGWFQGRMEFGPRALGNRSIIVDPRRAEMKNILNQRIKKREPFRPFAPSILEEHTAQYFEQDHPAPTMLMVYQVRPERRHEIPAVTHVDGSGRLQTVSSQENARYYQLISDFYELTGVPIVLNTSFNENEPIVCTPQHAIECFLKTRMDVLYLGNHAVRRPAATEPL